VQLKETLQERFAHQIQRSSIVRDELTLEISKEALHPLCVALREDALFDFKLLLDVCGVDYLQYGVSEWQTFSATATGFERGVDRFHPAEKPLPPLQNIEQYDPSETGAIEPRKERFASVYHLLSLTHNRRLRIRVFLSEHDLKLPSVVDIWPSANWFERESFDLFGIIYEGHPDLRRILTDYGFVGHPFRKDFPLIGQVEARYDASLRQVVYEPVSITPRILEPKVIRDDNRYEV